MGVIVGGGPSWLPFVEAEIAAIQRAALEGRPDSLAEKIYSPKNLLIEDRMPAEVCWLVSSVSVGEARPWRRSAIIKLSDSTRAGFVSNTRFIAACPISRTSVSSSARTFAVRGSPVNSAI